MPRNRTKPSFIRPPARPDRMAANIHAVRCAWLKRSRCAWLGAAGQTGRVVTEQRLDGGNAGGAVRVGDTVRRTAGPWTPAVHALLAHLASQDFAGSPRPLGLDEQGREVLTFLPGETVGSRLPWPGWAHDAGTLVQVARWLRGYHDAVAGFVPPAGARWRMAGDWAPGLVIGHNDAAPYNAVWRDGRLAGFIDWDMAGPVSPGWDLAYAAFSWVPLHARRVVAREGFTDFAARPERLRRFLDSYGWACRWPGSWTWCGTGSGRTWPGCAAWPRPAIRCSPGSSAAAGPTTWRPRWPSLTRSGSRSEYRYPGQWQLVTWPPATVTAAAGES